ncbi:hypothetical protein MMB17_01580 [Methylobacterium organophilum]|uniref:hypothetical protein n=1 Tax=Methylobacterium organophilum TaxID=410 RepID=UPI001F13133A|nr:hypothetical protein [Methylobacterium organophilum]UMY18073.1 hypothetical protein MMB17_01580 [Methylobacterium organophilum]
MSKELLLINFLRDFRLTLPLDQFASDGLCRIIVVERYWQNPSERGDWAESCDADCGSKNGELHVGSIITSLIGKI